MPSQSDILIIDDDATFCDSVSRYFGARNISVQAIGDPHEAQRLSFDQYRVVFLDIDMPGVSGVDLLVQIRRMASPVVIMVSGQSDEATRLACLRQGADFFFSKPVHLEELRLVAIRAMGRDLPPEDSDLWVLSRSECAVRSPGGGLVGLSSSEFRLLEHLFSAAPDPVAKNDLARVVTGDPERTETFTRALEVMISRLRARTSTQNAKLPVKALRNFGYVFHGAGKVET
jgi:DNA-binding response OmpR family regulator